MRPTIIVLLILVLGIGGWLVFGVGKNKESIDNQPTTQSDDSQTEDTKKEPASETGENTQTIEESATVSYSDAGFSPANITISAGQTVIFVNNSSRSMWVASDPHPIHDDFPAFDSGVSVSSGQSYQFTFDQPGSYGFHNHLRSSDGGTITVE